MVVINNKRCDECGTCVGVCPKGVLLLKKSGLIVDEQVCTGCSLCITICPVAAIAPKK